MNQSWLLKGTRHWAIFNSLTILELFLTFCEVAYNSEIIRSLSVDRHLQSDVRHVDTNNAKVMHECLGYGQFETNRDTCLKHCSRFLWRGTVKHCFIPYEKFNHGHCLSHNCFLNKAMNTTCECQNNYQISIQPGKFATNHAKNRILRSKNWKKVKDPVNYTRLLTIYASGFFFVLVQDSDQNLERDCLLK